MTQIQKAGSSHCLWCAKRDLVFWKCLPTYREDLFGNRRFRSWEIFAEKKKKNLYCISFRMQWINNNILLKKLRKTIFRDGRWIHTLFCLQNIASFIENLHQSEMEVLSLFIILPISSLIQWCNQFFQVSLSQNHPTMPGSQRATDENKHKSCP